MRSMSRGEVWQQWSAAQGGSWGSVSMTPRDWRAVRLQQCASSSSALLPLGGATRPGDLGAACEAPHADRRRARGGSGRAGAAGAPAAAPAPPGFAGFLRMRSRRALEELPSLASERSKARRSRWFAFAEDQANGLPTSGSGGAELYAAKEHVPTLVEAGLGRRERRGYRRHRRQLRQDAAPAPSRVSPASAAASAAAASAPARGAAPRRRAVVLSSSDESGGDEGVLARGAQAGPVDDSSDSGDGLSSSALVRWLPGHDGTAGQAEREAAPLDDSDDHDGGGHAAGSGGLLSAWQELKRRSQPELVHTAALAGLVELLEASAPMEDVRAEWERGGWGNARGHEQLAALGPRNTSHPLLHAVHRLHVPACEFFLLDPSARLDPDLQGSVRPYLGDQLSAEDGDGRGVSPRGLCQLLLLRTSTEGRRSRWQVRLRAIQVLLATRDRQTQAGWEPAQLGLVDAAPGASSSAAAVDVPAATVPALSVPTQPAVAPLSALDIEALGSAESLCEVLAVAASSGDYARLDQIVRAAPSAVMQQAVACEGSASDTELSCSRRLPLHEAVHRSPLFASKGALAAAKTVAQMTAERAAGSAPPIVPACLLPPGPASIARLLSVGFSAGQRGRVLPYAGDDLLASEVLHASAADVASLWLGRHRRAGRARATMLLAAMLLNGDVAVSFQEAADGATVDRVPSLGCAANEQTADVSPAKAGRPGHLKEDGDVPSRPNEVKDLGTGAIESATCLATSSEHRLRRKSHRAPGNRLRLWSHAARVKPAAVKLEAEAVAALRAAQTSRRQRRARAIARRAEAHSVDDSGLQEPWPAWEATTRAASPRPGKGTHAARPKQTRARRAGRRGTGSDQSSRRRERGRPVRSALERLGSGQPANAVPWELSSSGENSSSSSGQTSSQEGGWLQDLRRNERAEEEVISSADSEEEWRRRRHHAHRLASAASMFREASPFSPAAGSDEGDERASQGSTCLNESDDGTLAAQIPLKRSAKLERASQPAGRAASAEGGVVCESGEGSDPSSPKWHSVLPRRNIPTSRTLHGGGRSRRPAPLRIAAQGRTGRMSHDVRRPVPRHGESGNSHRPRAKRSRERQPSQTPATAPVSPLEAAVQAATAWTRREGQLAASCIEATSGLSLLPTGCQRHRLGWIPPSVVALAAERGRHRPAIGSTRERAAGSSSPLPGRLQRQGRRCDSPLLRALCWGRLERLRGRETRHPTVPNDPPQTELIGGFAVVAESSSSASAGLPPPALRGHADAPNSIPNRWLPPFRAVLSTVQPATFRSALQPRVPRATGSDAALIRFATAAQRRAIARQLRGVRASLLALTCPSCAGSAKSWLRAAASFWIRSAEAAAAASSLALCSACSSIRLACRDSVLDCTARLQELPRSGGSAVMAAMDACRRVDAAWDVASGGLAGATRDCLWDLASIPLPRRRDAGAGTGSQPGRRGSTAFSGASAGHGNATLRFATDGICTMLGCLQSISADGQKLHSLATSLADSIGTLVPPVVGAEQLVRAASERASTAIASCHGAVAFGAMRCRWDAPQSWENPALGLVWADLLAAKGTLAPTAVAHALVPRRLAVDSPLPSVRLTRASLELEMAAWARRQPLGQRTLAAAGSAHVVLVSQFASCALAELASSGASRESSQALAIASELLMSSTLPWPREVDFWAKSVAGSALCVVASVGEDSSFRDEACSTGWGIQLQQPADATSPTTDDSPQSLLGAGLATWGQFAARAGRIAAGLACLGELSSARAVASAAVVATWRALVASWASKLPPETMGCNLAADASIVVDLAGPRPMAKDVWPLLGSAPRSFSACDQGEACLASSKALLLALGFAGEATGSDGGCQGFRTLLQDTNSMLQGVLTNEVTRRAGADSLARSFSRTLSSGSIEVSDRSPWRSIQSPGSVSFRIVDLLDCWGGARREKLGESLLHPTGFAMALFLVSSAALPTERRLAAGMGAAVGLVQISRRLCRCSPRLILCPAAEAAWCGTLSRVAMGAVSLASEDSGRDSAPASESMLEQARDLVSQVWSRATSVTSQGRGRAAVLDQAGAIASALRSPTLAESANAAQRARIRLFGDPPRAGSGLASGASSESGTVAESAGPAGAEVRARRRRSGALAAFVAAGAIPATLAADQGSLALSACMDAAACSQAGVSVLSAAGDATASAAFASMSALSPLASAGMQLLEDVHAQALHVEACAVVAAATAHWCLTAASTKCLAAGTAEKSDGASEWNACSVRQPGSAAGERAAEARLSMSADGMSANVACLRSLELSRRAPNRHPALGHAPAATGRSVGECSELGACRRRAQHLEAAVAKALRQAACAMASAAMASAWPTYALASEALPHLARGPLPHSSEPSLASSGAAGSAEFDDALMDLVIGEEAHLDTRSEREAEATNRGRIWASAVVDSGLAEWAAAEVGAYLATACNAGRLCSARSAGAGSGASCCCRCLLVRAGRLRSEQLRPDLAVQRGLEVARAYGSLEALLADLRLHGRRPTGSEDLAAAFGGSSAEIALVLLAEAVRWSVLSGKSSLGQIANVLLAWDTDHTSPGASKLCGLCAAMVAGFGRSAVPGRASGSARLLLGGGVLALASTGLSGLGKDPKEPSRGSAPAFLTNLWGKQAASACSSLAFQRQVAAAVVSLSAQVDSACEGSSVASRGLDGELLGKCAPGHGEFHGWARRLVIGAFGRLPAASLAPELSLARFLLDGSGAGDREGGVADAIERFWSHLTMQLPKAGHLAASVWLAALIGEAASPALQRLRHRIAAAGRWMPSA